MFFRRTGRRSSAITQSFQQVEKFLGVQSVTCTDRDEYWQVVRHSSGAARINHIDLEIQKCAGQPPRYKQRLEEALDARAFVQWKVPSLQTKAMHMHKPRRHLQEEYRA